MRRPAPMLAIAAALSAPLLGGCDSGAAMSEPGSATIGERRALGEAAEMLDQQRLPADRDAAPAAGWEETTTRE